MMALTPAPQESCIEEYFNVAWQEHGRRGRAAHCPLCRASIRAPMPIKAKALSGRPIEVTPVPSVGEPCHIDRNYTFSSLGGFARSHGRMFYLLACNEDRRTAPSQVMWTVHATRDVTIHLNFRSERHVDKTGASVWLAAKGWRRNERIASTVSSGIPNGPYTGPVFSRRCEAGTTELMGSNTWEGVYFVFVEIEPPPTTSAASPAASAGSDVSSGDDQGASGGEEQPPAAEQA